MYSFIQQATKARYVVGGSVRYQGMATHIPALEREAFSYGTNHSYS